MMIKSVAVLLVLLLVACGQKGALYLPDDKPSKLVPQDGQISQNDERAIRR